jgi:hypothetical protein
MAARPVVLLAVLSTEARDCWSLGGRAKESLLRAVDGFMAAALRSNSTLLLYHHRFITLLSATNGTSLSSITDFSIFKIR